MLKRIILIIILFLMTGCTATYNLKITEEGFEENLIITATTINENSSLIEVPLNVFYDVHSDNEGEISKVDGVEYYEYYENTGDNGFKSLNYRYLFKENNFKRSKIVNTIFDTFIMKQYDHDEDGADDYVLISTDDVLDYFEHNASLEKITININSDYKIISSNADLVDNDIHTWYLTRDNKKAINFVYDPFELIDNKSMVKDVMNILMLVIVIILILCVCFIGYKCFKRRSINANEI